MPPVHISITTSLPQTYTSTCAVQYTFPHINNLPDTHIFPHIAILRFCKKFPFSFNNRNKYLIFSNASSVSHPHNRFFYKNHFRRPSYTPPPTPSNADNAALVLPLPTPSSDTAARCIMVPYRQAYFAQPTTFPKSTRNLPVYFQ